MAFSVKKFPDRIFTLLMISLALLLSKQRCRRTFARRRSARCMRLKQSPEPGRFVLLIFPLAVLGCYTRAFCFRTRTAARRPMVEDRVLLEQLVYAAPIRGSQTDLPILLTSREGSRKMGVL